MEVTATSGGRFMTLDAPTLGGYMTFETGGTAYADIGSASGIIGSGTDTDLLIIKGRSGKSIALGAGGATALTIDTSQNVGIGTTAPSEKLHIDGNTKIAAERYYYVAGTGGGFGSDHLGNFKIKQNGADLIFGYGDNVGIGTDAPSAKLHIEEATAGSFVFDGNADTLIVESNANGGITIATAAANTGRIIFASPNDATSAEIKYDNSTNLMTVGTTYGGGGSLILQAGSGVEAMRILESGNTGIGTSAPGVPLEVSGDMKVVGKTGQLGTFFLYADAGEDNTDKWKLEVQDSGSFSIQNKSTGSFEHQLTILNGGDCGIGTYSPQSALHINGAATLTAMAAPSDPAVDDCVIWLDSTSLDLMVKITGEDSTVTRVIASFEE